MTINDLAPMSPRWLAEQRLSERMEYHGPVWAWEKLHASADEDDDGEREPHLPIGEAR